ncbi:MAG: hypothetical protein V3T58_04295 [Candidatus Hydrothermarchaeales archaeon]
MLKLTSKRAGTLTWIIENVDKKWSIYELAKDAETLDYSATHTFVKELEKAGFVIKMRGRYRLSNAPGAVQYLSLFQPFQSRQKEDFYVLGDMKAKMKLVESSGLSYAFTLFSAGELLYPYVKTEDVHAYISTGEFDSWREYLIKEGARRAVPKEANMVLIPVGEDYYFTGREIRNHRIAPIGIVLADLLSYGGVGREQANAIQDEWLRGRANV